MNRHVRDMISRRVAKIRRAAAVSAASVWRTGTAAELWSGRAAAVSRTVRI